uniref:Immunoglobulin V-set domain-containing protein n=1 Tax=Astyanax mexicanus TaxID=7994 RepID=A0A3B1K548_ASTMX
MWLPLSLLLITETVLGVKVEQSVLFWVKPEGQITDLTDSVHWYQQKDGEALRRILYVNSVGSFVPDFNLPDVEEFTVARGTYDLKVLKLKKSHSAVYYCASWESGSHSESNPSYPVSQTQP